VGSVVFGRLEEVRARVLGGCLALGAWGLVDVNWKILKVISSNARSFTHNSN
jgi:hypothetical protein